MEENIGTYGFQEATLNQKIVFKLENQSINEIHKGFITDENPSTDNLVKL